MQKRAWFLAGLLVAPGAAFAGDTEAGRAIAEAHCSRCHVVGEHDTHGGIGSTPSFALLVERRPDYQERFLTFFARRPHPSFLTVKEIGRQIDYLPPTAYPVEITLQDVENVAAYVETLKGKSKTGP